MFCFTCVKKLNDRRCPICRTVIRGIREHPEFKFPEINNNNNNQIPQPHLHQIVIINNQPYRVIAEGREARYIRVRASNIVNNFQ